MRPIARLVTPLINYSIIHTDTKLFPNVDASSIIWWRRVNMYKSVAR